SDVVRDRRPPVRSHSGGRCLVRLGAAHLGRVELASPPRNNPAESGSILPARFLVTQHERSTHEAFSREMTSIAGEYARGVTRRKMSRLSQVGVLIRVFLGRFFENEATAGPTDLRDSFFWLIAALAAPGLLFAFHQQF